MEAAWLKTGGMPRVRQVDLSPTDVSADGIPFPLIAKPARGSPSNGLRVVETPEDIRTLDRSLDYVLEEIAPGDEYTVFDGLT